MVQWSRRQYPADMQVHSWPAADGWPLRSFGLPATGTIKGEILFLGGRADFFEKYLEPFQIWRNAGWSVTGFDWRGQGGSGELHAGKGCHIDDFAIFIDDLAAFSTDWCARTAGPRVMIGHSMGAHVLLRAVAQGAVAPDAMVLLAPMLGIRLGPLRGRAMHRLATIGRTPVLNRRLIWTGQASPVQGHVTSCSERRQDKQWWKAQRPDLAREGPSWGWLAAATRSIALLERELRAVPSQVPGLMLVSPTDAVIDVAAIRRLSRLLPAVELALIGQAGHELLRERDEPRMACLAHIDRLLDRVAGQHAVP